MTLVSKTPINDIFYRRLFVYTCCKMYALHVLTRSNSLQTFLLYANTTYFHTRKSYFIFFLSFFEHSIFFQPFNIKIWTFHIELTRFSIRLLFISKITFTEVIQRVYQPETRGVRFL